MQTFKFFFYIFFPLVTILKSQPDSPIYKLNEVVITANRVSTNTLELANSNTIITKDEIKLSQKNTVFELLRTVPGISISNQGGPGKVSSLFIRGANSNHTLITIDGIKLNDPSSPNNGYDLSNIQLNGIERIEIVRGPQSVLYGSDAMAGIVNIITSKGSKISNLNIKGELGSNNHFGGMASLAGSINNLRYDLSFSRIQTKGFSAIDEKYGNTEKDGNRNNSFDFTSSYRINSNIGLTALYRYNYSESDIDRPTQFGDDPNYTYDNEEQVFGTNLTINLFDDIWVNEISASLSKKLSHNINKQDPISDEFSFSYNNSQTSKIGWQNNLSLFSNNALVAGLEYEQEQANTYNKSINLFGEYESVFPVEKISTTSLFLHDQLNLHNNIFLGTGVRYDHNQKFGALVTYRITPAYYLQQTKTKFKASLGKGFKAPSIFNLYDPLYGNKELKPEKSIGWDLGIEQFINSFLKIEVNYFNNGFTDLIGYDDNFKTINIDKAETNGLEFILSLKSTKNFSADLNYTYTNAVDKSEKSERKDQQLIRRPKHKANLKLSYLFDNSLSISAQVQFIGERFDNNFSTYPSSRVALESYKLVDLMASYNLFEGARLYGRIENLFDERYEEVLFYGTLRRAFYTGLELNIDNIF